MVPQSRLRRRRFLPIRDHQKLFGVLLGGFVFITFLWLPVVEGAKSKCRAEGISGQSIPLTSYPGIKYDPENDILQCLERKVCSRWKISNCTAVQCQGYQACEGTKFWYNPGVACWSPLACRDAVMVKTSTVACGIEEEAYNACNSAQIEVDQTTICYGPFSCTSDDQKPLMFTVGTTGVVECSGGQDGGGGNLGAFACRNLEVIVQSSTRACISINIYDDVPPEETCAVICPESDDCDTPTIRFKVHPEGQY